MSDNVPMQDIFIYLFIYLLRNGYRILRTGRNTIILLRRVRKVLKNGFALYSKRRRKVHPRGGFSRLLLKFYLLSNCIYLLFLMFIDFFQLILFYNILQSLSLYIKMVFRIKNKQNFTNSIYDQRPWSVFL